MNHNNLLIMRSFWQITNLYQNTSAAESFSDLASVFSLEGESITQSPISKVNKVTIDNNYFYVKYYTKAGKYLRQFVSRSRLRAEWENMFLFSKLGLPTADIVGYGQEYKTGRFKRGALITAEIVGANDLDSLRVIQPNLFYRKQWLTSISKVIAKYTRTLHDHRFVHGDLKWRNILVKLDNKIPTNNIFFIDCPNGSVKRGFLLTRGKIKDLACLDKVAKQCLSNTDRLRFYKFYAQCDKLSKKDKHNIKKIIKFFHGRN